MSTSRERAAQRIVLAKVGLDGHDRGIRVVARGLRDAGFHVIYAGLWQRPEAVAQAVCDEDADWLGLSLLNGAHLSIVPRVVEALRLWGRGDVGIVVGGIIPPQDVPALKQLGVQAVFGPGTSVAAIVADLAGARPLRESASGNRARLARRLSELANGGPTLEAIKSTVTGSSSIGTSRRSRCVAMTGSPGVGKSSLIGRLLSLLRSRRRVAVLACDPVSPLTGGALLGDRIRMTDRLPDPDVFIRSVAVPSGSQGVTPRLAEMLECLGDAGYDLTLVETVGAGQGDVAVRNVADRVIVVLQPETGDAIQWQKAGLLEVADLVVVQKADLPGSHRFAAELEEALNPPGYREIPVLRVSASHDEGIEALCDWVERGVNDEPSATNPRSEGVDVPAETMLFRGSLP
ncbi:MAG TPA: cobalamin-dependent protein [Planctomycetaceae bacterium]|nr:cobalamin-dependent protein [Planctomycetaceae bacterium]